MDSNTIDLKLPAIVFTDLDGTLLDHNNYDWLPARATLNSLAAINIPVIFNTSKTRAELEYWRNEIGNQHPFITENGSAIFIPTGYPEVETGSGQYDIIELGVKRTEIRAWLQQHGSAFQDHFVSFAELSPSELIQLTDLPESQAEMALKREYSEAIHWHGDENLRTSFINRVKESGYQVLIGGRFLHILGNTNKGKAAQTLLSVLQNHYSIFDTDSGNHSKVSTIACGDSQNDIDMLNWADVAIVIRSPKNPTPPINNPIFIISHATGPSGWAEAFQMLTFK